MNLGILGDDPALIDWAERATDAGARIAAYWVDPELRAPMQRTAPSARQLSRWTELNELDALDAIVVGGGSAAVATAAFELAKSHSLLILPHPDQYGADIGLLDLQADPQRVHRPAFPLRFEPAVREYAARIQTGELGEVRLLKMERIALAPPETAPRLPQSLARSTFLEDVDLLRALGAEYERVTALRLDAQQNTALQVSATMAADVPPEAVWQLTAGPRADWSLSVVAQQGDALLRREASGELSLRINGQPVELSPGDARTACLQDFLETCRRDPAQPPSDPLTPQWEDCSRAFSLTAAVDESLRRRRTVPPRFGGNSEREQFKTQMTAVGCGVLCWTLMAICAGLLLGRVLDPRDPLERRAATAGTILAVDDFEDASATLSPAAAERLAEALPREGAEAIVLIEPAGDPFPTDLDRSRAAAARDVWQASALPGRPPQIEIRPLSGRGFQTLMLTIWSIAFAPLGLFLMAQLLIVLTKPRN